MGEWRERRFADLLDGPVRNGIYKQKQFHGRGCKIVNMGELFAYPRLGAVEMKRVELNSSELSRFSLAEGDLIFARRSLTAEGAGKCSIVAQVREPTTFESSIIRARPARDRVSSYFLYYYFNSPRGRHAVDTIKRQVAVSGITGADLSELKIQIPELPTQRQIAAVLSALDDKIELSRRMNEMLEAIARALFRDWFVDFGPTRAKMERRPAYLAPDLWSLFPDRLDDRGRPGGWRTFRLEEIAEQRTATVNPAMHAATSFEHYSLPAYDSREQPAIDLGASIKSNKTQVPENAILLSKLNPETPRVWVPDLPTDRPQIASTEFLAFVANPRIGRALLYSLFNESGFRRTLEGMVTGTSKSHQRISPKALAKLDVLTATSQVIEAFEATVSPLLSKILANRSESRTLAETRDALLPKLMSGEITIRQAGKTPREGS